jgi:hypothetical protein
MKSAVLGMFPLEHDQIPLAAPGADSEYDLMRVVVVLGELTPANLPAIDE